MSRRLRALAPAKINLGLFVGAARPVDGRHELASVMQSISLADVLTLEEGGDVELLEGACRDGPRSGEDEVICPGVQGPPGENLATVALKLFRAETAWDGPPLRLSIDKRIPVAAGLGGGSADAAAALRLVRRLSGLGSDELVAELARRLGADVPAQVAPGRWLATGAGERLRELPSPSRPFGVLVLALAAELSAGDVYAQLDESRAGRHDAERRPGEIAERLRISYELGAATPEDRELMHNDLQAAAISLCPEIEPALAEALDAGADVAFVSGSGPTVVGLFLRANGPERARRAVASLSGRDPAPDWAEPVNAAFALAHDIQVRHNPER